MPEYHRAWLNGVHFLPLTPRGKYKIYKEVRGEGGNYRFDISLGHIVTGTLFYPFWVILTPIIVGKG